MWISSQELRDLLREVRGRPTPNPQITELRTELMSALSDVTDSLAALSTSVDAAIAASGGDPAVAAALAADEAGLVDIKASIDGLKSKIDAALAPPA